MRRTSRWLAGTALCLPVAVALGLFPGCSESLRPEETPPPWLVRLPSSKGAIYAVGVCGPTYRPSDAIKRASDNAREELAKSLGGRIQSVTLVKQSSRGPAVQRVSVVEATAWATDVVVSCSQVVASWVDVRGVFQAGKPGTTYALGLLDFTNVSRQVSDSAGKGSLSPEAAAEIRKQAEKALTLPP